MIRRLFVSLSAIAAVALMSIPALAKPNADTSLKATIILASNANLGSTALPAGQYDVVVEGNQAKFVQHGKTVAEVPCTLKDMSSKASQTGFQIDNHQLTEIRVSGKTQAIEFSTGPASGN